MLVKLLANFGEILGQFWKIIISNVVFESVTNV